MCWQMKESPKSELDVGFAEEDETMRDYPGYTLGLLIDTGHKLEGAWYLGWYLVYWARSKLRRYILILLLAAMGVGEL